VKREGGGKFGIIMLFHDSVQNERVQLTVPQTQNKARKKWWKKRNKWGIVCWTLQSLRQPFVAVVVATFWHY